jgi:hypothetical protein
MKRVITLTAACAVLAACATNPDKVSSSYISPLQYGNYDCDQIRAEMIRVSAKVSEISGVQKREATKDAVALGVGLVLFWPALFFMMGQDKKEELGTLKGQYDALQSAAIEKKCPVAQEIEDLKRKQAEKKT